MSIIVSGLTKIYDTQKAVDHISFEIKKGEIVGFLGPNGAGKSTTMKIVTTFLPATSGSVSVCGFDVLDQSMEVRKRVGYLPEANPLYFEMYVREFLEFTAGIHKLGKDTARRIEEMISLTGLTKESNKKIGALSKGYKQRVGLAQAMLHNPEVLILDEPTSGLDPNQIIEIRELIKNIGADKTVLLSTHIMQEVQAMSDAMRTGSASVVSQKAPSMHRPDLPLIPVFRPYYDDAEVRAVEEIVTSFRRRPSRPVTPVAVRNRKNPISCWVEPSQMNLRASNCTPALSG